MDTISSEGYTEIIYFKTQRDMEFFESGMCAEEVDYPDEGVAMKWEEIWVHENNAPDYDFNNFVITGSGGYNYFIAIHCRAELEHEDGEWVPTSIIPKFSDNCRIDRKAGIWKYITEE